MRHRSKALALLTIGFAGCSGEASHVPPLWALPGAAVSSAFENVAYDAKRGTVQRLVSSHRDAIAMEIDAGGGVRLSEAMAAAGVPVSDRARLVKELRSQPDIYRDGRGLRVEPVIVALMVHGNR